jgi:cbb3-type cytochrome oxidase maturation protein
MSVIFMMLPIALLLAGGFLAAFLRAAAAGQYDDLETPAHRILLPDPAEASFARGGDPIDGEKHVR